MNFLYYLLEKDEEYKKWVTIKSISQFKEEEILINRGGYFKIISNEK